MIHQDLLLSLRTFNKTSNNGRFIMSNNIIVYKVFLTKRQNLVLSI